MIEPVVVHHLMGEVLGSLEVMANRDMWALLPKAGCGFRAQYKPRLSHVHRSGGCCSWSYYFAVSIGEEEATAALQGDLFFAVIRSIWRK